MSLIFHNFLVRYVEEKFQVILGISSALYLQPGELDTCKFTLDVSYELL